MSYPTPQAFRVALTRQAKVAARGGTRTVQELTSLADRGVDDFGQFDTWLKLRQLAQIKSKLAQARGITGSERVRPTDGRTTSASSRNYLAS